MKDVPALEAPRRAGRLSVVATATALAAVSPVGGAAETRLLGDAWCQATVELERMLERRLGATRHGAGLRGPDEVVELWRDPAGDWVLVARHAGGRSCILATGAHWDAPLRPRG